MGMVEVKTAELIGVTLDWAVGEATDGDIIDFLADQPEPVRWQPSTDLSLGGALIRQFQINLTFERKGVIYAHLCADDGLPLSHHRDGSVRGSFGPTHIIAACRAIVAAKLGDVVRVPAELLEASHVKA